MALDLADEGFTRNRGHTHTGGGRMQINTKDAGEYFRGLMLLVRADHRISHEEGMLLERVGKALGLELEFCRNAMREILDNPWVEVSPPYFEDRMLAENFVRDGLMLAAADGPLHAVEIAWLRKVAEVNGLGGEWFEGEKNGCPAERPHTIRLHVEGAALRHV